MSFEIGIVLMPLYAILSWIGLITQGNTGKYVLPVALTGWVWAGINIYRTKRFDLGILTFFFVLLSALAEREWGFTRGIKLAICISSIMVAGNYSLVVFFWKEIKKDLAKSKSVVWMNIFVGYCMAMMAFWVCVVAKSYARDFDGFTVIRPQGIPPREGESQTADYGSRESQMSNEEDRNEH